MIRIRVAGVERHHLKDASPQFFGSEFVNQMAAIVSLHIQQDFDCLTCHLLQMLIARCARNQFHLVV